MQDALSEEPEECYWWQVRKGPPGKRRWGFVDDNVNKRLERAFRAGDDDTIAEINGWWYYYDLVYMMQISPMEGGTRREIRRVICDGDSDEGWTARAGGSRP